MTLTEAFLAARGRRALPTALSTAAMRARFRQDVLRRSVISARTASLPYLSIMADTIEALLQGERNGVSIGQAEARVRLKLALEALHYDPEKGHFGLRADAGVPPAARGSIQDLSSDVRLNLIIDTQRLLWQSAAANARAKEPDRLWASPCWELRRSYSREPRKDWERRWRSIGGELYEGRIIAPVGSPLWDALGDSGRFEDALGVGTPPFAFGSKRAWRAVSREECIRLGVPLPAAIPPPPEPTPDHPSPPPPAPLPHDLPPIPPFNPPPDANPGVVHRMSITLQMGTSFKHFLR